MLLIPSLFEQWSNSSVLDLPTMNPLNQTVEAITTGGGSLYVGGVNIPSNVSCYCLWLSTTNSNLNQTTPLYPMRIRAVSFFFFFFFFECKGGITPIRLRRLYVTDPLGPMLIPFICT